MMNFLRTLAISATIVTLNVSCKDELSSFQPPLGFELEKSTLAEISAKLGAAAEFEIPDSHHQFGICYQSDDSEAIVIFSSGREFGGPEKRLLHVTIQAENERSFPCSTSTLRTSQLNIGEMKLGLTPEQFQTLSNDDAELSDEGHLVHNLGYRGESGEPDVGHGIWCKIDDGRATQIGVWQISTY